MATTLMPLEPAASPQSVSRLLSITARLLPDEVVAARRARRVRTLVISVLAVFILLLGGWYAFAYYQASTAEDELNAVNQQAQSLQRQQADFSDVVGVQEQTTKISKLLTTLMAQDLRWASLFSTLRSTGTGAGVKLTSVSGTLATAPAGGAAATTGGASGSTGSSTADRLPSAVKDRTVASLIVTGTAPDKAALARYVEALADVTQVRIVANPYLNSAVGDGGLQWSLQLDVIASALGGRFASGAPTPGGN
jgi:cytoskeletal protein RodZ